MPTKGLTQVEFGDFQTPADLAREVCRAVLRTGYSPASVVEPTCGRGTFLRAALEMFSETTHFFGADRNAEYVAEARQATNRIGRGKTVQILHSDFFETDWHGLVARLPTPILILGNPPWVTNSALGALYSENLPEKSNQDRLRGIEALTGKSNFDISEWMLRQNLSWLANAPGAIAVLCKTAVARKILFNAWTQELPIESAAIRRIDAKVHFDAAVDACLLFMKLQFSAMSQQCPDYCSLEATSPQSILGMREGTLVADVRQYERWSELRGPGVANWRSGIKHDCSGVFELVQNGTTYRNGQGIDVEIEPEVVFPLLKSSDLAGNRAPRKWLLVPHRNMSASPEELQIAAPKAWQYLVNHHAQLIGRRSTVYRNRPPYSVFGIGDYSFTRWKVAISGLYKQLKFVKVPPFQDRPVVLDDTCYFLSCRSKQECKLLQALLQSEPAQSFFSSLVFWDAKRPITAQILNSLNLSALARVAGKKLTMQ